MEESFAKSSCWVKTRYVTNRPGPGTVDESYTEAFPFSATGDHSTLPLLIVGAGGLGCDYLKTLAMCGFRRMTVIDMDTIELANLNRQFLFSAADVGRQKAATAASAVMERVPGCTITPVFGRVEEQSDQFFSQFRVFVLGLDSLAARLWVNQKVVSLSRRDAAGVPLRDQLRFLVDGGSEGFKGHCTVVIPWVSACLQCLLFLYPPRAAIPLCTLQHHPRRPEHCIAYAKELQWGKEMPFGPDTALDPDCEDHVAWIVENANKRAREFDISAVSRRDVLTFVKHVVPIMASTNGVVGGMVANEVLKLATGTAALLRNHSGYSGAASCPSGISQTAVSIDRDPECVVCGVPPPLLLANVSLEASVEHFLCTHVFGAVGFEGQPAAGERGTQHVRLLYGESPIYVAEGPLATPSDWLTASLGTVLAAVGCAAGASRRPVVLSVEDQSWVVPREVLVHFAGPS